MNKKVVSLKTVFCALFASAALLSSCSSDDKDSKSNDFFTLDDSKKALSQGVLFYDANPTLNEQEELYYRNEILLFSDGLKTEEEEDGEVEVLGKGNAISIDIVSYSATLETGTYVWTGEEEDPEEFEIWDAGAFVNFNTSTGTGARYSFTQFSLTVAKDGDTYTLEFSGTAYPSIMDGNENHGPNLEEDPIAVTGSYTGIIEEYSGE